MPEVIGESRAIELASAPKWVSWCHTKDNDGRRASGVRHPRGKWHRLSDADTTLCGRRTDYGLYHKYKVTDQAPDGPVCARCMKMLESL